MFNCSPKDVFYTVLFNKDMFDQLDIYNIYTVYVTLSYTQYDY